MTLSDIFFVILYGGTLVHIFYFIFSLLHKQSPSTVVVYQTETPVLSEYNLFPWVGGGYNYWPQWAGWYSGGGNGGYNRKYNGEYHGQKLRSTSHPWGGTGRSGNGGGGHR